MGKSKLDGTSVIEDYLSGFSAGHQTILKGQPPLQELW